MASFNCRSKGEPLQILLVRTKMQESKKMQMLGRKKMHWVRGKMQVHSRSARQIAVPGLGILYFHGDIYKMDSSFQQGVILVISSHIFLCTLAVHINLSINSRADLGVGPGVPGTPFCPIICFSFVNVCLMALRALLFSHIFFNKHC